MTTYKDAGVDIEAGDALVERIKPLALATHGPQVLGGLGGFGALFSLEGIEQLRHPVLVASTDGVGTKVKLAIELGRHDTIGIDLVAMVVNDIATTGARPLFFLDYYASGKLDVDTAAQVVAGIAEGCKQAGCALIGGETAEMPGVYAGSDYDLAGFAVGIADRDRLIDGTAVEAGAELVGLGSSGIHSNGYSLVRKLYEDDLADHADELLEPTRIYVKTLTQLIASVPVQAIAHITGGGITGNVPRVLRMGQRAVIDRSRWSRPAIFDELQRRADLDDTEMYRTFNMGLGIICAVPPGRGQDAVDLAQDLGEQAWVVGEVQTSGEEDARVELV